MRAQVEIDLSPTYSQPRQRHHSRSPRLEIVHSKICRRYRAARTNHQKLNRNTPWTTRYASPLGMIPVDVDVARLWQQAVPKLGDRMLLDPTVAFPNPR